MSGLLICEARAGPCDKENKDAYTVTIRLEGDYGASNTKICGAFGESVACVKVASSGGANNHIGDRVMILEEPPWEEDTKRDILRRYAWTDDTDLDYTSVRGLSGAEWRAIDFTTTHEFGHTLGLEDIRPQSMIPGVVYDRQTYNNYTGIMKKLRHFKPFPLITADDMDYLESLYRGHSTAGPQ